MGKPRECYFRSVVPVPTASVRWNAWANTCCVAGYVAVSAAIVPGATFTHFNATYVILRAAARRVRAPIRLSPLNYARWTWLLPR